VPIEEVLAPSRVYQGARERRGGNEGRRGEGRGTAAGGEEDSLGLG
jgi:hypothetical protein